MKLRILDTGEHGRTRLLWEKVFPEDSRAFLDYYYFFKTRENEIYVIEEADAVRSMLQLNPYPLQVEEAQFEGHYVVGVATEEAYRKRGYMGALLRQSMQNMYRRKELFTFLMPAAEAIYTPYDFRSVYNQSVWKFQISAGGTETDAEQSDVVVSEAGIGDGAALAEFFRTYYAEQFQVCTVRTDSYYQTMLFEQQSENGGIRILRKEGKVVGSFLYGDEEGLEIREPLYLKEYENDFWRAVFQLCRERGQEVAAGYAGNGVSGDPSERSFPVSDKMTCSITETMKKPTIMVRILHLESLLKVLKTREGETVNCSFAVLDSVLPQNSRVWRLQSKELLQKAEEEKETPPGELLVHETEDSEGVLSIAALTSLLFGDKSVEEIAEEPEVFMTERLMTELGKIQPLNRIYLNEIV